jgi:hypothetical protein
MSVYARRILAFSIRYFNPVAVNCFARNDIPDRRLCDVTVTSATLVAIGMSDEQRDAQTRDETTGKYGQDYTDNDFLAVLWDATDRLTTDEVAEAVGCSEKTAYTRLTTLEANERVTKRSVRGAYLWSLSDDERDEHTD